MAKVVAIGIDADATMVHFLAECRLAGYAIETVNLRRVALDGGWSMAVPEDGSSAMWEGDGDARSLLGEASAIYCRPVGVGSGFEDPRAAVRWGGLVASLMAWLNVVDVLVVNHPACHAGNGAKPYHEALLVAHGFDVPASLTTSDVATARAFIRGGRTIVKACSGVRANTRAIAVEDLDGYSSDHGPLHVQRLVEGSDVRAHVVGGDVHAVLVDSTEVDYRRDQAASYRPWRVPHELADPLVRATAALGLSFAGWDLKLDGDGRPWVLEANPMPGYDMYDGYLGGAISRSLMDLLAAG